MEKLVRSTRNHEFGKNLRATRPLHEIILLTMDIFISWSGERSRAAAEALRNWLPKIINAIKPWLSSADIDKGARWSTDIASRLEAAKVGIICLTPRNLHSDWILFEAGALSKTLNNTFVCPFLIGLEPSDVKPPLSQFQATRAVEIEVLKLLGTLNKALGEDALDESHIKEAFEVWWPKLESQLNSLPSEEAVAKPHREDRELLEEILGLVRSVARLPDRSLSMPDKGIDLHVLSKTGQRNFLHEEVVRVLRGIIPDKFKVHSFDLGASVMFMVYPNQGEEFLIELKKDVSLEDIQQIIRNRLNYAESNTDMKS